MAAPIPVKSWHLFFATKFLVVTYHYNLYLRLVTPSGGWWSPITLTTEQPNLKVKTWPKQLLDSLLLASSLPAKVYAQAPTMCRRWCSWVSKYLSWRTSSNSLTKLNPLSSSSCRKFSGTTNFRSISMQELRAASFSFSWKTRGLPWAGKRDN